jgi:hypothetical protein
MATTALPLRYSRNLPSHRAVIAHCRGKRMSPDPRVVAAKGRTIGDKNKRALASARRAPPRCGYVSSGKSKLKPKTHLGAALGSANESERAKTVDARLNNLIRLPCQREPVAEPVDARMAAVETPDNSPIKRGTGSNSWQGRLTKRWIGTNG